MGLRVKKTFPFSVDEVEGYLRIEDVVCTLDRVNTCTVRYAIFLSKDSADRGRALRYFRHVWLPDPVNAAKIVPPVLHYFDEQFFDVTSDTTAIEIQSIKVQLDNPIYVYGTHAALMQEIYTKVKEQVKTVDDDLESDEEFKKRVINPFLAEVEFLYKTYLASREEEE